MEISIPPYHRADAAKRTVHDIVHRVFCQYYSKGHRIVYNCRVEVRREAAVPLSSFDFVGSVVAAIPDVTKIAVENDIFQNRTFFTIDVVHGANKMVTIEKVRNLLSNILPIGTGFAYEVFANYTNVDFLSEGA